MEIVSGYITLLLALIIWGNVIPCESEAALNLTPCEAGVTCMTLHTRLWICYPLHKLSRGELRTLDWEKLHQFLWELLPKKMGCNITFWEWPRAIWRTARDCNTNRKLVRPHLWYDYKELFRHSQLQSRGYSIFTTPKFPDVVRLNLTGHYEDENMWHQNSNFNKQVPNYMDSEL
jgi:hypothetical protein